MAGEAQRQREAALLALRRLVRASSPSIVSFQSSRCGPTSVTPRSISARRRAIERVAQQLLDRVGVGDAERLRRPLGFVGRGDRPAVSAASAAYARVHRGPEPLDEPQPAAHELRAPRARAARRTRRASRPPSDRARPIATARCVASTPVRSRRAPRRNARRASPSSSSRYTRRSAGPPFTSSRSSGANTVTRSSPWRSRVRVIGCACCTARGCGPIARISASNSCSRSSSMISARTIACVAPVAHQRRVGHPAERLRPRDPRDRLEQARLALPVRAVDHREPGIELEVDALQTTEIVEPEVTDPRDRAGRGLGEHRSLRTCAPA